MLDTSRPHLENSYRLCQLEWQNPRNSGIKTIPLHQIQVQPCRCPYQGNCSSLLKLPETKWPKFEDEDEDQNQGRKETLKEMKAATKLHDNSRESHVASVHEDKEDNPILCHLLQSCSTFTEIRRVLARVHRFVDITRRRAVPKGSLTVQGLKRSELQLLKWS